MTSMQKLGKFGHTFRRGYSDIVQTVEQRTHSNEGSLKVWKFMSLCVGTPLIIVAAINSYVLHQHGHHERPEYILYPHLKIMHKPFPWGDGKHSFFHNPKTNFIPGIGYEED